MEVQLHLFLTSALGAGEFTFTSLRGTWRKETAVPIEEEAGRTAGSNLVLLNKRLISLTMQAIKCRLRQPVGWSVQWSSRVIMAPISE